MKIPSNLASKAKPSATSSLSFEKVVMGLRLDESTTSYLEYVNYLNKILNIQHVDFLHVAPFYNPGMNPYLGNPITGYPLGKIYKEEDWKRDKEQLSAIRGELTKEVNNIWQPPRGTTLSYTVREGAPVEELIARTKELEANLVVIGKNKDTNRHQINAKNIIRHTSANVLLIPENTTPTLERILVPFDYSENSIRALRIAVEMKHWMPADPIVQLVFVYDEPDYSLYKRESYRQKLAQNQGSGAREVREPELKKDIHLITVKKDKKNIAHYLLEKGKECNSDLIIMGAKGHSRLELFFLGSTTERLVGRNNSIPMLVVK